MDPWGTVKMRPTEGQAPFPHALRYSQTRAESWGRASLGHREFAWGNVASELCQERQFTTSLCSSAVNCPHACRSHLRQNHPAVAKGCLSVPLCVSWSSYRRSLPLLTSEHKLQLILFPRPHVSMPPNIWGCCRIPRTRRNTPRTSHTSEQVKASVSHNSCPTCFSLTVTHSQALDTHICVCAYPATHECTLLSSCPLPFRSLESSHVVLCKSIP